MGLNCDVAMQSSVAVRGSVLRPPRILPRLRHLDSRSTRDAAKSRRRSCRRAPRHIHDGVVAVFSPTVAQRTERRS
jgi:hypothetical protein